MNNRAENLLTTAKRMLASIETIDSSTALLSAYLQCSEEERSEEGTAEAKRILSYIYSGDWGRDRIAVLRREQLNRNRDNLFNEAYRLINEIAVSNPEAIGESKEEKRARKRERRLWRNDFAVQVWKGLKEGKTGEQIRREAGGVSGFTLQRAYKQLKRVHGMSEATNAEYRQYVRTGIYPLRLRRLDEAAAA